MRKKNVGFVVGDFVYVLHEPLTTCFEIVELRHIHQPKFDLDYKLALVKSTLDGSTQWVNVIYLKKLD